MLLHVVRGSSRSICNLGRRKWQKIRRTKSIQRIGRLRPPPADFFVKWKINMKKIIIFISLIFFLFVGISVYSQEPSPTPLKTSQEPQTNTKTINQASKNDHNISTNVTFKIDGYTNTAKTEEDSNNGTTDSDAETSSNWWMAWFTGALVLVAICQFVAMILQYRAMRDQVKELRESVDATKEIVGISNQSLFTSGNQSHHMAVAAQAAKKSAESLPIIERAYIFVKIEEKPIFLKAIMIFIRPCCT